MVYQAYHGEKVAPFYQKEMMARRLETVRRAVKQGWVATVAFTKDGQKASATVTPKGQISDVMIEVTKEQ